MKTVSTLKIHSKRDRAGNINVTIYADKLRVYMGPIPTDGMFMQPFDMPILLDNGLCIRNLPMLINTGETR